jgi:ABC-type uncharacterized transport system ATPase subunit
MPEGFFAPLRMTHFATAGNKFPAHGFVSPCRDVDVADRACDFDVVAGGRPFVTGAVHPYVAPQIAERLIIEDKLRGPALEVNTRRDARRAAHVRDLAAGGVTVLLTTQYLEEADLLADRIAVLDRGKLAAEGTPAELKSRIPGGHIRLQFADASALEAAVRTLGEGGRDDSELTLRIATDGSPRSLKAVLDRLDREALSVESITVHTPDLDDVYFELTGHPRSQKGGVQ